MTRKRGTKSEPITTKANPPKGDYKAYVGFRPVGKDEPVKIEVVLITDAKGNLIQRLDDVSPIGDIVGKASDKKIKVLLERQILEEFDIRVKTANIHLLPFDEVDIMLFKRDEP